MPQVTLPLVLGEGTQSLEATWDSKPVVLIFGSFT
jgi:hypothetical protein